MSVRLVLLALLAVGQAAPTSKAEECTAHMYWGKVYYYTPAQDESTWDRPAGCTAEYAPIGTTHYQHESPQAALQHSVEANSLNFLQSIHKAWEPFPPQAITLTIQADLGRIKQGALNRLAKEWNGPISVAVLTTNLDELLQYMSSEANMHAKNWADVHAVVSSEKWKHYPINRMRNFAIKPVRTEHMMVIDIDEDVTYTMAHHMSILTKANPALMEKAIYIVPSFQWSIEYPPQTIPHSQRDLADLMSKGQVAIKHPEYTKAYGIPGVDFQKWKELNSPIEVQYSDAFEPYFIARKNNLPLFDERFQGFGGNKAIHTLRLALEGFHFVLLPTVFTWCKEAPSTSAKHNPPANPTLSQDAWWELGHAHGCDDCSPELCVKNCPEIFNKDYSAKVHAGSPAGIAMVAAPSPDPTVQPSPSPSPSPSNAPSPPPPPPAPTATSSLNFIPVNFEAQKPPPEAKQTTQQPGSIPEPAPESVLQAGGGENVVGKQMPLKHDPPALQPQF